MSRAISEGDTVDIHFDNVKYEFKVKILSVPYATGDSWYVEREDGTKIAVQNFAKMVRVEKHPTQP